MPIFLLLSALLAAEGRQTATSSDTHAGAACRFTVWQAQVEPTLLTSPRARIMAQPDSPVKIVRADLRGMVVVGTGENHSHWGDYSVDVRNVSDRVVTNVEVRVFVMTPDLSGGASGNRLTTPLPPGAVATVRGRAGRGEGIRPAGTGDPVVYVLIESVDMAGCRYEPAKTWPRPARRDAFAGR